MMVTDTPPRRSRTTETGTICLMSIEERLAENTAAINRNSDLLERVVAGQAAAIEKIEGAKPSRTKPAAAAPAATPAAEPAQTPAAAEPAATPAAAAAEPTPAAAAAPAIVEVSDDDVKAAALAWMAKVDPTGTDMAKKTECAQKLTEIVAYFGLDGKLTGPQSKLDAEQRQQALFFINRWAAGLTVDFSADYDFDGDPTQGAAPAAAEDPLG